MQLTVKQAAERLGVSLSYMYDLIARGKVAAIKEGGRLWINEKDLTFRRQRAPRGQKHQLHAYISTQDFEKIEARVEKFGSISNVVRAALLALDATEQANQSHETEQGDEPKYTVAKSS